MRNINQCIITGTVGRDAELAVTKSGASVCKFSIAHNRVRKNQQTNQWETVNTTWWRVSYFGNDAEALASQIKKRDRVTVTGSAELNEYTARDGSVRVDLQLTADSVDVRPDLRGGLVKDDPWGGAPKSGPFAKGEQGGFPQNEQPPF